MHVPAYGYRYVSFSEGRIAQNPTYPFRGGLRASTVEGLHCVTGRIFLRDKHEKKASKIEILASAKRNARLFDHLSHIFPLEKGHRLRSVMKSARLTTQIAYQVAPEKDYGLTPLF